MSEPKWDDTIELPPSFEDTVDVPALAAAAMPESVPVAALPTAGEPGYAEALVRSGYQGITQGFGDELIGGGEALLDKLLRQDGGKTLAQLYEQHRDESRAANAAAQEAHPWLYTAGNIAGGVAALPALGAFGGAGVAAKIAGAAKAAPVLTGAAQGAVAGLGFSDADNALGMAGDVAMGGGIGAGAGLISKVITGQASEGLKKTANKAAVRAIEPNKGDHTKLIREGLAKGDAASAEQDLGRWLLDKKVVTAGANLEEKLARATAATEESGEAIGNLMQGLDNAGARGLNPGAAQSAVQRIANPYAGLEASAPTYDALSMAARDVGRLTRGSTFKELQAAKNHLDDLVERSGGWKAIQSSERNAAFKDAYKVVKELQENAVRAGAGAQGAETLAKYVADKSSYGAGKTAQEILTKSAAGEAVKQPVSLGAKVIAAGEIASGHYGRAAAELGIMKGLKTYGYNLKAVGADKLSDVLQKVPQSLGKYAPTLLKAAERGQTSLAATHAILLQTDSGYRQKTKELFDEQNQGQGEDQQ